MADLKNVTAQNVACAAVKMNIRKLRKLINPCATDEEKVQTLILLLSCNPRLARWITVAGFGGQDLLRLL